jgi:hypothetical protein
VVGEITCDDGDIEMLFGEFEYDGGDNEVVEITIQDDDGISLGDIAIEDDADSGDNSPG